MILALRILEFNMQTILNAHIHLDAAVRLRRYSIAVHPYIFFSYNFGYTPGNSDSHKVA